MAVEGGGSAAECPIVVDGLQKVLRDMERLSETFSHNLEKLQRHQRCLEELVSSQPVGMYSSKTASDTRRQVRTYDETGGDSRCPRSETSSRNLRCRPQEGRGPDMSAAVGPAPSSELRSTSFWLRGRTKDSLTETRGHSRNRNKIATKAAYESALQSMTSSSHVPKFLRKNYDDWMTFQVSLQAAQDTQTCCGKLVESRPFVGLSVVLILANAAFIGYAADLDVREAVEFHDTGEKQTRDVEQVLIVVDTFFTCAFTLELILKIIGLRLLFWIGPDWKWNFFDVVVVISAIFETLGQGSGVDTSFMRLLRVLKMIRTVRVIRHMRLFSKLRLMLLAIMDCTVSLLWAMVLLISIMFLFAVIFVQGTAQHLKEGSTSPEATDVLSTFFHSLPMALLTLCMTVSGGVSWWDIERVLLEVAPVLATLLVIFVAFMILALLNIVTGIFVNDSIDVAQNDRELRTLAEMSKNSHFLKNILGIFREWDTDGSGTITLEEFTSQLHSHEIKALFSALGIEINDAYRIFEALDVDGNLELEIDEFVMGCANFRGQAKAVDIETLKGHNKRLMIRMCVLEELAEEQVKLLRNINAGGISREGLCSASASVAGTSSAANLADFAGEPSLSVSRVDVLRNTLRTCKTSSNDSFAI